MSHTPVAEYHSSSASADFLSNRGQEAEIHIEVVCLPKTLGGRKGIRPVKN